MWLKLWCKDWPGAIMFGVGLKIKVIASGGFFLK